MRLSQAEAQLKLQKWITLIQDSKASGMKLKDWLYENNISKDQYYYWYRKLKTEVVKSNLPAFVEVSNISQTPAVVQPENLNVACKSDLKPAAVIRFSNCSIEINNNASVEMIANLVKALAYVK